ncbi:MAG: 2-dehydro-3-deoxygalactonokinase, partial [Pseudomonadota bacterium]
PGTHTKWVHISAGEIVSFRTAMTGEMFALLSTQSVLRHSMGTGWDAASFASGVSQALSRPEGLAASLFSLRAEGLLDGLNPDAARARLSGLLIGAELAAMRPYWLGQQVALIGAESLSRAYADALAMQSVPCHSAGVEDMTLAGLTAAWTQIYGEAA